MTLAELNARAKEWFPERNRLVVLTAPEKPGLTLPDQARLAAVIKAALGATYSVSTNANYTRLPTSEYTVSIQFGSDPARMDALVARMFQEIEELKTDGPSAQQANEIKQSLLRDFETNSRSNSYLLGQIVAKYQYGEDVEGLWDIPKYYEQVDAAAIQAAAKTYLDPARYVRVTLVPEKK